jgi:N-acetylmuramoyl-L-alanine amidase
MFKIALDAGHGLHTGGKRCLRSLDPNETREWWLNNRICDEIERILESEFQKGVDYDLIRLDDTTGETDIDLDVRVAKANKFNADYLLSIHHNAGANGTSVGGPTVHIRPYRDNEAWAKMGILWDNFIGQANKIGFSNRMSSNVWVNRFKVISGIKNACLFECGFMDSRVDIKYILREDYAMAVARGFADGLIQIGGLVSTKEE